MKLKTVYVCQSCEAHSTKWAGKCDQCGAWNSFVEDVINIGKEAKNPVVRPRQKAVKPVSVINIGPSKARLTSGMTEVDQVLGGGCVDGSLVLLSG